MAMVKYIQMGARVIHHMLLQCQVYDVDGSGGSACVPHTDIE